MVVGLLVSASVVDVETVGIAVKFGTGASAGLATRMTAGAMVGSDTIAVGATIGTSVGSATVMTGTSVGSSSVGTVAVGSAVGAAVGLKVGSSMIATSAVSSVKRVDGASVDMVVLQLPHVLIVMTAAPLATSSSLHCNPPLKISFSTSMCTSSLRARTSTLPPNPERLA